MKGALVAAVEKESLAAGLGLEAGDRIVSVNGKPLQDLIQFQFEWAGEKVFLEIEKESKEIEFYEIDKEYDEQLGVVFAQAVFDGLKTCRNKCLFCFVEQMPAGMRPSLYLKDDDYRLSFLQGSYITLTNLEKEDLERISKEHLSPLYVSVHATIPQVRKRLLQNPRAAHIVEMMQELSAQGIEFHTQVVLCPGINDGHVLAKTYQDLSKIAGVKSIALVPVGLTQFRDGLPELKRYSRAEARQVVFFAQSKWEESRKNRGSAFIWPSDEFYLIAGEPIPSYESYEEFPQLENGVGLIRIFWERFARLKLPTRIEKPAEYTLVTSVSGEYALKPVVASLNSIEGLKINCLVIKNRFFGPSVTVSGLLTGECLLRGLEGTIPHSKVLIPNVMLKDQENRFLDDLSVDEVARKLNIELIPVPVNPECLIATIVTA